MSGAAVGRPGGPEAWFAERLGLVACANADRALSPVARHVLIEILLEEGEEPEDEPGLPWSERLARRLGITARAVRKGMAQLVAEGLIERDPRHGDVLPWPRLRRIAERVGRAPVEAEPSDPIDSHALRLERLRDLCLAGGLYASALSAERAIGRALGYAAAAPGGGPGRAPEPAAEQNGRDTADGDAAMHTDGADPAMIAANSLARSGAAVRSRVGGSVVDRQAGDG